jgi:hypothetical protein
MFVRDRPFNLKGGGYGFLFRSEIFFRWTQELEYLFLLSRKARNFFPELNIGSPPFKLNGRSLTNMVATSDSWNRNYSAILATLQITSYVDSRNSS